MEGLIKAVADFFAAILGTLGFVGKPRLRHGIREDMQLLDDLGKHSSFGIESKPYVALRNRVAINVEKLAGVDKSGKKIPWGTVIAAFTLGVACVFWTYKLDHHGFRWISILPGFFAFLLLVSTLGMVFPPEAAEES